ALTELTPSEVGAYSDASPYAAIMGSTTFEVIDPVTGSVVAGAGLDGNNQPIGTDTDLTISPDGRYVLFNSIRTDLVAGLPPQPAGNAHPRTFVKDLQTGTFSLVSFAATDTDPDRAFTLHSNIAADRYVAFQSHLSGGATDTNNAVDIYL